MSALVYLVFSGVSLAGQCSVDGHGPYDMDRVQCFQLCRQQASTDCILKQKTSTSKIEFVEGKVQEKYRCQFKRVGKECQLSEEPTPDKDS